MVQLKLFFCADSAAIDMRLNTLSAFHIVEELNTPVFPVAIARVAAVMIVTRDAADPNDLNLTMRATLGEQQLFDNIVAINFAQRLSVRIVGDINGLVIAAPGVLRFQLRNQEQELGVWNIAVNQVGQPALHPAVVPGPPAQPDVPH